ncbi:MAG: AzlC family ABC transporter permease [Oscillospiraceae bacterium]|nr:AzlC family ABC transporter permease [Oscillospiraceae bacterium]
MTEGQSMRKDEGAMEMELQLRRKAWREGVRDGVPIALGYFAVAFSLGIAGRNAGLTPGQGFIISILNHASAGEYAGITAIAAAAPYWELAITILITNARYLLMSCALSQKFAPETSLWHRIGVGFGITDEIFGVTMARPGAMEPRYTYGAMAVSIPSWALGTALGITAGNILPLRVVSALSVALYGMFLAIIIPPARKDRVVGALVFLSFFCSFTLGKAAGALRLEWLTGGTRVILLTLLLAGGAAALFPVKEEENHGR